MTQNAADRGLDHPFLSIVKKTFSKIKNLISVNHSKIVRLPSGGMKELMYLLAFYKKIFFKEHLDIVFLSKDVDFKSRSSALPTHHSVLHHTLQEPTTIPLFPFHLIPVL